MMRLEVLLYRHWVCLLLQLAVIHVCHFLVISILEVRTKNCHWRTAHWILGSDQYCKRSNKVSRNGCSMRSFLPENITTDKGAAASIETRPGQISEGPPPLVISHFLQLYDHTLQTMYDALNSCMFSRTLQSILRGNQPFQASLDSISFGDFEV